MAVMMRKRCPSDSVIRGSGRLDVIDVLGFEHHHVPHELQSVM